MNCQTHKSLGGWIGLVGGIAVAAAIVMLIGWNIARLVEGRVTLSELACVDPTDPCNRSSYRVVNDTFMPVVLRECLNRCERSDSRFDPIYVAPGATTADSANEVNALVGALNWWEVQAPPGRPIGCLVLDGHAHKHDGDKVRVSSVEPCSSRSVRTPWQG